MRYKISYPIKYNNGIKFNQTLNVSISRQEFNMFNYAIATAKLNAPSCNTNYKHFLDTFKKDINYASSIQIKFFAEYFGIIDSHNETRNKRFKQNRNTIVIINII